MKERKLPPDWDVERTRRVLEYYKSQSEDEAVAEDEEAFGREAPADGGSPARRKQIAKGRRNR